MKLIIASVLGLSLFTSACTKKSVSSANSPPAGANGESGASGNGACIPAAAAASLALGTFAPMGKLDPSQLTTTIKQVQEQELTVAKSSSNSSGGLYHTALITLSSALTASNSEVRPDGFWLEICPAAGGSCASRLVGNTALIRQLPSAMLTFEASACLRKDRSSATVSGLDQRTSRGEQYTCGKSTGKKKYSFTANSGDVASVQGDMVKSDQMEEVFYLKAYQLWQHIHDFYYQSPPTANSKLSGLDKAMWNNQALGPEVFADTLAVNGFDAYDSLDQGSSQNPSAAGLNLRLADGQTVCHQDPAVPSGTSGSSSSAGGSDSSSGSLDAILKGLSGSGSGSGGGSGSLISGGAPDSSGSGTAGIGSGSDTSSGAGAGSAGGGASVAGSGGSTGGDQTTSISGQPVPDAPSSDYMTKRVMLLTGVVAMIVGTIAYKSVENPAAPDAAEQAAKKTQEHRDKILADEGQHLTSQEMAEHTDAVVKATPKATPEAKLAETIKAEEATKKELTDTKSEYEKAVADQSRLDEHAMAETELARTSPSTDAAAAAPKPTAVGDAAASTTPKTAVDPTGTPKTAITAVEAAALHKEKVDGLKAKVAGLEAKLKNFAPEITKLQGETSILNTKSAKNRDLRSYGGLTMLAAGALLTGYAVFGLSSESGGQERNFLQDQDYLKLSNDSIAALELKRQIDQDTSLLLIAAPATQRTVPLAQ